eukprot:TRINITY_DN342_c0_g1_i1.p2 TRINITY_DN342_c0_g1~~TRINITY_DN342_c0_g1_i1.p2  ORF type:complete len:131 (-),score=58.67 TRINITY_DN342_c0_g1_i1:32-424(-)
MQGVQRVFGLAVLVVLALLATQMVEANNFQHVRLPRGVKLGQDVFQTRAVRDVEADSPTPISFSAADTPTPSSGSSNTPQSPSTLDAGEKAAGIIGFSVTCALFLICILVMIPVCIVSTIRGIHEKFFKK